MNDVSNGIRSTYRTAVLISNVSTQFAGSHPVFTRRSSTTAIAEWSTRRPMSTAKHTPGIPRRPPKHPANLHPPWRLNLFIHPCPSVAISLSAGLRPAPAA